MPIAGNNRYSFYASLNSDGNLVTEKLSLTQAESLTVPNAAVALYQYNSRVRCEGKRGVGALIIALRNLGWTGEHLRE